MSLVKISMIIEIPEENVVDLEKQVYDYASACGGKGVDYRILPDTSLLMENNSYFKKLIYEKMDLNRRIGEIINNSDDT